MRAVGRKEPMLGTRRFFRYEPLTHARDGIGPDIEP